MARTAFPVMFVSLVLGRGLAFQFRHMHGGEALLQTAVRRTAARRAKGTAVDIAEMFELMNYAVDAADNQTANIEGGTTEVSTESSVNNLTESTSEPLVGHVKSASNISRHWTGQTGAAFSHWSRGATDEGKPATEVVAFVELMGAAGFHAVLGQGNPVAAGVAVVILLCLLLPLLSLIFACCLSGVVKASIESLDRKVMGVDVEIGRLSINPFMAYILVEDFVIGNPEGYAAPYLMKVDKIYVNLNASSLFCSCAKNIVVDDLVCTGLDVIYAKKMFTSNFNEVIDFLSDKDADDAKKKKDDKANDESASKTKISLRRVLVEDVGMKIAAELGGGLGPRIAVGNIDYDDFSEEVGDAFLSTAISVLLRTVLKSAVVNTVGQGAVATFSEMRWLKPVEGAEANVSNALGGIASHLREAVHHEPTKEAGATPSRSSITSWFRNPLRRSSSSA